MKGLRVVRMSHFQFIFKYGIFPKSGLMPSQRGRGGKYNRFLRPAIDFGAESIMRKLAVSLALDSPFVIFCCLHRPCTRKLFSYAWRYRRDTVSLAYLQRKTFPSSRRCPKRFHQQVCLAQGNEDTGRTIINLFLIKARLLD